MKRLMIVFALCASLLVLCSVSSAQLGPKSIGQIGPMPEGQPVLGQSTTTIRPDGTAVFSFERSPRIRFWRSKKFWGGVGLTALAVLCDQQSQREVERSGGRESSRFLRGSDGRLRPGRLWLVWGVGNAFFSAVDLAGDLTEKSYLNWSAFVFRATWAGRGFRVVGLNYSLADRLSALRSTGR